MFRLVTRHKVSVTDFSWFGGLYRDKSAKNIFARFAVEPETFLKVFDDAQIVAGSKEDWLADRTGALVGRNIAEKFGWKLGDKIPLVGDIFPINVELTIRGIYYLPNGTSATCFFSRRYLEEAVPFFKGNAGTFWIKAKDAEAAERIPRTVDAMFENSPSPTKTETEKQFQNFFVQMMGNVKLLLGAIATVIVAVIVLIAANTMAMTARERVTEIAVLRTLGFQRRTILSLILGESLVIALFGGFLGVGLFVLLEPGMKRNLSLGPMASLAASLQIYPSILALGFGIAVGVGVLAGIFPAIRSAQRSIVEGLRAT